MLKTVEEWHQRYAHQTQWTKGIANHIFNQLHLPPSSSVLEVGCGTGASIHELLLPHYRRCFGIDINPKYLFYAKHILPEARLSQADAHHLPFADHSFDLCLCHFLLLWVARPIPALSEMVRITRSGGVVIALAEPDHGSRIDFPRELSILGEWQSDSLLQQGANPTLGRQLRSLFSRCGLLDVHAGVLGGEWSSKYDHGEFMSEWDTLRSDLATDTDKSALLPHLMEVDVKARKLGDRILFVPTFYAWGRVP